eukprot:790389-Pelagomonas_calceolata.AAC.4
MNGRMHTQVSSAHDGHTGACIHHHQCVCSVTMPTAAVAARLDETVYAHTQVRFLLKGVCLRAPGCQLVWFSSWITKPKNKT